MEAKRLISTSFWSDSKVIDDFTPEDRYFFLYLMTNTNTDLTGCYEISIKQMSRDTGYNEETVSRLLDRLIKNHQVIDYDYETKEVLIINWNKYNWTRSPKLMAAVSSRLENIKNKKFREYVLLISQQEDTVSIQYRYTSDTTNTITNTNTISNSILSNKEDNSNKSSRFIKPTIEEISDYCIQRKNNVDPESFFNFYEAKGWMIGPNKMKDWKACVRTWEKNNRNFNKKQSLEKVIYQQQSNEKASQEQIDELMKKLKGK